MESRELGRLREEAEDPGEAVLQGLLTCRLHISELQSSLIFACWVTGALPSRLPDRATLAVHLLAGSSLQCLRVCIFACACKYV